MTILNQANDLSSFTLNKSNSCKYLSSILDES